MHGILDDEKILFGGGQISAFKTHVFVRSIKSRLAIQS